MNQSELDQIKARAQTALPDDSPPNMEKVKAMALFRQHAANDVLELVAEVERLRAERQNHTLIHNDALAGLVAENERLYKGNVFSCGCRFSASPIGWGWDFCDLHASVHLQKREIERLRSEVERLTPKPRRELTPEEIKQRIDDNFFDEEYD